MLNIDFFSLDDAPGDNYHRTLAMEMIGHSVAINEQKQAFLISTAAKLRAGQQSIQGVAPIVAMCSIGAPQADDVMSTESLDENVVASTIQNIAKYLGRRNEQWATLK